MSSLDLNPELPATTRTSGSRETLEDYTLRYAPLSFRRWGPGVVAVTALGGIAYLADFSIGASIGMAGAPATPSIRSGGGAGDLPHRHSAGDHCRALQH